MIMSSSTSSLDANVANFVNVLALKVTCAISDTTTSSGKKAMSSMLFSRVLSLLQMFRTMSA